MKEYLSEVKQVLEEQRTSESGLSSAEAADRLSELLSLSRLLLYPE